MQNTRLQSALHRAADSKKEQADMTRILPRQIGVDLPVAVGGKGIELIDSNGRSYIDASGGAAVSCLGHGHPDVNAALHAQIDQLAYVHSSFFTTDVAERLADKLIEDAPDGLSHVYFVSGGSEAIEASLKMARQYFVEKGEPKRTRVIARRQSYHGNTLGALAAGGNEMRRTQFRPLLIETAHVDPCFAYRFKEQGESDQDYAARAAKSLEDKILELGPDTVMAFVAETVVGATSGAVPPVADYFKRIRAICDRYGVLLVLDEVMSGMGRTGTLHACEQEGIAPDLMTIAKGLGGGYQPIGAVLLGQKVFEAFDNGSKVFQHGHTYLNHPVACAAALAVQTVIKRDNLLANVRAQGEHLARRLGERFGNHPYVGDIRGRGLFQALEFLTDRGTKAPFDPKLKLHARVKKEAAARGLLVYPSGGTIDGARGDHALIAPPFIVREDQIDAIVERLGDAVDAAVAGL
jgi:adenosylmethionine-8-amino-7-oxononanoate aminotransferase